MSNEDARRMSSRSPLPLKSIGTVCLLLGWDVGMGQPLTLLVAGPGALIAAVALLVNVVRAHLAWRSLPTRDLVRPLVFAVASVASVGWMQLNLSWAQQRADQVISAVDTFRAERGHYPKTLAHLVPDYLDEVPSAFPLRAAQPEFGYSYDEEDPHFRWVVLPPFGRRFFGFGNRTYGFVD